MIYYLDKYKFCPICKDELISFKEFIECSKCGNRVFDNAKPSVNVIIENERRELLVVTRKINPFKGWLDLPGGFSQAGETLEETGKREMKEELGVNIKIGEYIGSYALEYEYGNVFYKLVTAFFVGHSKNLKITVGDDASKFEFIPRSKILKMKICYPRVNKSAIKDYFRLNP